MRFKASPNLINYYPHSKPKSERIWQEDYIQVCSIDPAIKNYAIRIERRYRNGSIDTVIFHKEDLSGEYIKKNIYDFFNKILLKIKKCHLFIIEKQPGLNGKIEMVSFYTLCYLVEKVSDSILLPGIYEINSRMKGTMLKAGKLERPDLKKWSVETAIQELNRRRDIFGLECINSEKKKDDLADTLVQIIAFFKYIQKSFDEYRLFL